tara:strand:- start:958 stop:1803 length:846 start_codon:yes stop_codon:yes gene_type:complete
MKRIKHSKVRNTGLIFELLVRQVAVDTMNNTRPLALDILNKHFKGSSELSKELKLYRQVQEEKFNTEAHATTFVNAVIKARKALNESDLKRQKYNLIKDLKENYNVNEFFKSRVSDYKLHASIFNIFEYAEADEPATYIRNKYILIEKVQYKQSEKKSSNSLMNENKDVRLLASKIVIDKFNEKYKTMSASQKKILREYINNVTNSVHLKKYIISETKNIQKVLASLKTSVPSKIVRIKINEVVKLIGGLRKKHLIEDKDILTMLRYYELIGELKKVRKNK